MSIGFYLCEGRKHPNNVIRALYLACPYDKQLLSLDDFQKGRFKSDLTWGMYKQANPATTKLRDVEAESRRHIIVEMGYIGRGHGPDDYYSLSIDGYNGRSLWKPQNKPPDRANKLGVILQPWKSDGNDLVIGQVTRDSTVQHTDHKEWIKTELSKRPNSWFRGHPGQGNKPIYHIKECTCKTLETCLKAHDIGKAITFNSTAGVETILSGIPTVTKDRGSMVWDVTSHDYSKVTPDRQQWLNNLAYRQYKLDEFPWSILE